MILADKIINERKKNGWSQEDLAERLGVSRQSVSKWEGAQAIPDLQKIIAMADIFGVTTDYLLKDEIEAEVPKTTVNIPSDKDSSYVPPRRRVSMEEANEFISITKKTTPSLALAVSCCILSPATLIALAGFTPETGNNLPENVAVGIGLLVLFAFIAFAVFNFVTIGSKLQKFEYLKKEDIETEYGVSGMVKEKKESFKDTHTRFLAVGIMICVICPVPLIASALAKAPEHIIVLMVSLLLSMVAVGVNLIMRGSTLMEAYDMLLEEGNYTEEKKAEVKKSEAWTSVYWGIVTAGYLAWSFITKDWGFTWIVWPVAGVLYGTVISNIISAVSKKNR
ncbi:MAG: helix-turn-helix domain-containing protein [Lachnospiraceae bacterium]|nr:helix-turn-helix domain-containing protein [Lachnospiraceae bacterium]